MRFTTDTEVKAELGNGKRVCQCGACEAFFTGEESFTRHLTAHGTDHVHCKTPAKMLEIGMCQNRHGVWLTGVSAKQKAENDAA